MSSSSSTAMEAQMRLEIARLTASINQAKSTPSSYQGFNRTNSRSNSYVNPNYRPASNKYVRPTATPATASTSTSTPTPPAQPRQPIAPLSTEVKDVVLNGVAFESSGRSLVRKDLPKPASGASASRPPTSATQQYARKSGHLIPASRTYKPKPSRPRPGRPANRNMTLTNNTRPYQNRRTKSRKYVDKPCPRFTTTGSCSRGLTCPYKHDPTKIAICWNFLQGNCPNSEETCNLSHDPIPERTPLCVHFVNKGRCTRDDCPFPHVNVGARHGVCRDFAVLGYCEKGLDCDKQHVRECPDFAEKGTCSTKGCKLPHVIRANRNRKPASKATVELPGASATVVNASGTGDSDVAHSVGADVTSIEQQASDANFGDGFIPLTFNESESDEESDEDEDEDEGDSEEGSDTPEDEQE